MIRARNADRDRGDESNTHRGNKNEKLKELTERDAGKKANDYK